VESRARRLSAFNSRGKFVDSKTWAGNLGHADPKLALGGNMANREALAISLRLDDSVGISSFRRVSPNLPI